MKKEEPRAMGKGVAKKAKSVLQGQTGIFSTLAKEHGMVSSLMNQALEGDTNERRKLFPKIKAELLSHAHAEEEEFYSVLLAHDETRDRAQHSINEHRELERLVEQIEVADPDSVTWLDTFERLRDRVEAHAKEEEQEVFPLAKKVIERRQLDELQTRFAHQKERELSAFNGAG